MKVFSEIKQIFQCEDICVSDHRNTVESSFETTFGKLPNPSSISAIYGLVPTRDRLTITFDADSGDILAVTPENAGVLDFSKLTNTLEPDDCISICIQIDKTISDQKFSIYDYDSFSKDLLGLSTTEILSWFSDQLHTREFLIFEVFDAEVSFFTKTLAFISDQGCSIAHNFERTKRLQICKETSYFYNMNAFEIVPEDFIVDGISKNGERFIDTFQKIATILSLIYSASSASITGNLLNVQFNGARMTTYSLPMSSIAASSVWQSIYAWIYSGGNATDKALIAHNVISLHCKYETLSEVNERVYESIKTNYNLYLRANVRQYLDLKKDISKFIQNTVTQVGDYALTILNKFKTNLIAIFGFLFTVVLTKIGTAQKWEQIFTRDTTYILEIVMIGSLIYLAICIFEVRYKMKKIEFGYDALKSNYEGILTEEEIIDAFGNDALMDDAKKSTKKGIVVWSIIWGILLLGAIIIIERLTSNGGVFLWLIKNWYAAK